MRCPWSDRIDSGWNCTPTCAGFAPIGSSSTPFTGAFNGLNNTISNATKGGIGLSSIEAVRCRLAGWLHDVGKVAIPDAPRSWAASSSRRSMLDTRGRIKRTQNGSVMMMWANSRLNQTSRKPTNRNACSSEMPSTSPAIISSSVFHVSSTANPCIKRPMASIR